MKFWCRSTLLILLLALYGQPGNCEVLKLQRRVTTPDNKPVAGVRVLVRSYSHAEGSRLKQTALTTDENGIFTAELTVDAAGSPSTDVNYAIVDTPGYALMFVPLSTQSNGRGRPDRNGRTPDTPPQLLMVHLVPEYSITGQVTSAGSKPVGGAQIHIGTLVNPTPSLGTNLPALQIATPELTARSQPDGSFNMRGFTVSDRREMVQANMWGTAIVDGALLAGSDLVTIYLPTSAGEAARTSKPVTLMLQPTMTVRGQVVSSRDKAPLPDATVQANPGFPTMPRTIVTDAAGRFEIVGVPRSPYSFTATLPHYAMGAITMILQQPATDAPDNLMEPIIALRPLATVSGRIVDMDTGKAPPVLLRVNAQAENRTESGGFESANIQPVDMQPDGSFAIEVGIGTNTLSFIYEAWPASSYGTLAYDKFITMDVPATGVQGLVVKARRSPTFLVRFESSGEGRPALTARTSTGQEIRYAAARNSKEWCFPAMQWGDKIQIRLAASPLHTSPETGETEPDAPPWIDLVADPDNWPIIIKIP